MDICNATGCSSQIYHKCLMSLMEGTIVIAREQHDVLDCSSMLYTLYNFRNYGLAQSGSLKCRNLGYHAKKPNQAQR